MTIDIVDRLRAPRGGIVADTQTLEAARDAADEIERLREQNRLLAMDKIELRGQLSATTTTENEQGMEFLVPPHEPYIFWKGKAFSHAVTADGRLVMVRVETEKLNKAD